MGANKLDKLVLEKRIRLDVSVDKPKVRHRGGFRLYLLFNMTSEEENKASICTITIMILKYILGLKFI